MMNNIPHHYWDEVFDNEEYKTIDQTLLLNMVEKVKDSTLDISTIWQQFKKIGRNLNVQKIIEREKPRKDTSEKDQHITASTSTATQQNTENDVKSEECSYFGLIEQTIKEISKKLESIDLIKQEMTDNMVDGKKTQWISDIKLYQFLEVMHQDEIRRIFGQLNDHGKNYLSITHMGEPDDRVRYAMIEEYFSHRIKLISILLAIEAEVLRMKLERGQMKEKSKIDGERSRLLRDNIYLWYIQIMHQDEIERIIVQLKSYCHTYNMPDKKVKIIMHRGFIMQKIGRIKKVVELKEDVMDFNLQIEQEAMNVETSDGETTDMSSKINSVKSMLKKNNKYLRYIAMKHQKEINRVYEKLKVYKEMYKSAIPSEYIEMFKSATVLDIEEKCGNIAETTNMSITIKMKKNLQRKRETLRDVATTFKKKFIEIYNQLEMYRGKYDMPNENVTIVMHEKPYTPTKTHDDENDLMKDNEYFAFVAMMHLEKIKEVCVFLKMQFNRFNERFKEDIKDNRFMDQFTYMSTEIYLIQKEVAILNTDLRIIEYFYKHAKV